MLLDKLLRLTSVADECYRTETVSAGQHVINIWQRAFNKQVDYLPPPPTYCRDASYDSKPSLIYRIFFRLIWHMFCIGNCVFKYALTTYLQ